MICIFIRFNIIILLLLFTCSGVKAQLSPGELSEPHSKMEGLSNCTLCHEFGNKVSDSKCTSCHTEIKQRIQSKNGYHSSSEVVGKECISCHSDHHGKKFRMIMFNKTEFDHSLTGFTLSSPHSKLKCDDCHQAKFISDQNIRSKKNTYLGTGTDCLSCHDDYHRKTLSSDCLSCHNSDSFKHAAGFDHNKTKFKLSGKHRVIDCSGCHKVNTSEGQKFQNFAISTLNCSGCHEDPHKNKFGQNCSQCHTEVSFSDLKSVGKFDHNTTGYRLEGKHTLADCKSCHKKNFSEPLNFSRCTDCHTDYHKGQFVKNGLTTDCSACHDINGFDLFSFTNEQHNMSAFPLQGSHLATACIDCHKRQNEWNFRAIGTSCKDCHEDIHKNVIDVKYYPEQNCKICHTQQNWTTQTFDHSVTEFRLTGAHLKQNCTDCHIKSAGGKAEQKFSGLSHSCSDCHTDIHHRQFDKMGVTDCSNCHETGSWKGEFDHDKTAFKLEGKHRDVHCTGCHKSVKEGSSFYINYKLKVFTCESCHS